MKASKMQAFPNGGYRDGDQCNGMTLRDWFAGQALVGILASHRWARDGTTEQDGSILESSDVAAGLAYKMADAMLSARMVEPAADG